MGHLSAFTCPLQHDGVSYAIFFSPSRYFFPFYGPKT